MPLNKTTQQSLRNQLPKLLQTEARKMLRRSFQKIKDKAGFVYLVLSIIKMLAVMILMAVVILGENNAPQAFALQFMVVYAVYLIFEVFTMVKKLNA